MSTNSLPAESYKAQATTLAVCWRITRTDGVTLGFTSHDRPLRIDGVEYSSSPGMEPSAFQSPSIEGGPQMEASGFVSGNSVTEADLRDGRFEDAEVRAFLIDWTKDDTGEMLLAAGWIGALSCDGVRFTAELLSVFDKLKVSVCERYSPECRAEFGDNRCRADLSRYEIECRVGSVETNHSLEIPGLGEDDLYRYGTVRALSGRSSGVERSITSYVEDSVWLNDQLPVEADDRVLIRQGCDKQFTTCRDRFHNQLNFRGEPNLPGFDAIRQYGFI